MVFMALTTVTVHGKILAPVTNVPAVGTVTFDTLQDLRDTVDNITYTRKVFTATLDVNGEFTIVLPATDNPDLTPTNWVYQVYVNTDQLKEVIYVQLPFAPGTTEFADLTPLAFDPCADQSPLAVPIPPDASDLFVLKSGDTMTGNLIINANLQVNGDAGVSDDLTVGDDLAVGGDVGVTGLGTFGVGVSTPVVTATTANVTTINATTVNTSDLNVTDDAVIGDDLQVTGDANVDGTLTAEYQGVNGDVVRLLSTGISTGPTSGGQISINANPALIDIAAMTGWIVDYDSTGVLGPTNPKITYINFAGQTGLAPLGTLATYWLINSAGAVITQSTVPTAAQSRASIFLGASVQIGGVNIAVRNLPLAQSQPGAQLFDLMTSLAAFNVSSNANFITPNGVNLNINTSGGNLFIRGYGINAGTYQNPHIATLAAQTPATFRYATATGLLAPFVTNIDVANYDPSGAGVVTPIGGGANTSSIHRVFIAGSPVVNEQIIIQYGQNTYSSLANARAAIGAGTFTVNPLFTGTLTGWICATRTATNLSDPTQATFVRAGKFAAP